MELDFAHATRNLVPDEVLSYLEGRNGNIILFGAGKSGDYFQTLLDSRGIKASCYCDNSPQQQGTVKNELPVYSYKDAAEKYPDACICITSCYSDEIHKQLKNKEDVVDVMRTCSWETTDKLTESGEVDFIRGYLDELDDVYGNILADGKSKDVMRGILNYRLTRKETYIQEIADSSGEYFDDSIIRDKTKINSFIDGGAWTGDTIDAFIDWKQGAYSRIWCFEAEKATSELLRNHIAGRGYRNISVFNNALWDKKESISFFDSNGSGGGVLSKWRYGQGSDLLCRWNSGGRCYFRACRYDKTGHRGSGSECPARNAQYNNTRQTHPRDMHLPQAG